MEHGEGKAGHRHSAQEYAADNANSFLNRINRTLVRIKAGEVVSPQDFDRLEFDRGQLVIEANASGDAELITKANAAAEEARLALEADEEK